MRTELSSESSMNFHQTSVRKQKTEIQLFFFLFHFTTVYRYN